MTGKGLHRLAMTESVSLVMAKWILMGGLFSLSSVGFSSTISKYANRARNASYNARNDDRERLWCKSATEIICSLVDICKIFAFCGIGHYSIDLLGAFWQAL